MVVSSSFFISLLNSSCSRFTLKSVAPALAGVSFQNAVIWALAISSDADGLSTTLSCLDFCCANLK